MSLSLAQDQTPAPVPWVLNALHWRATFCAMPAEFEPYTKTGACPRRAGFGCKDLEKDRHQDQDKHLEDSS